MLNNLNEMYVLCIPMKCHLKLILEIFVLITGNYCVKVFIGANPPLFFYFLFLFLFFLTV